MRNALAGFEYPASLEEALAILGARHGEARPLGGGTALVFAPGPRTRVLVDLSRAGLSRVSRDGGLVRVGATVTARRLATSPAVAEAGLGALVSAASSCGSRLLQNQITVGGNVVGLYPWSDLPPALLALGATARVRSSRATRDVTVEELVARHPTRQLAPDELLVDLAIPALGPGRGAAFVKFGRTAVDYTLCDVAAWLEIVDGTVRAARLAVGGLRPLPSRLRSAEAALVGKAPGEAAFADAARAAMAEAQIAADFRASRDYKRDLLGALARRALESAALQAQTGRSA